MEPPAEYLFGDSDTAAQRLEVLARVFAASTRPFLQEAVRHTPGLALDLGCGPGFSTALLAATLGPRRTVGLDSSVQFLETARLRAEPDMAFLHHDVTQVPFPESQADLIYARFLATHLENAPGVLRSWARQLAAGGLLLADEVEWIRSDLPVFREYLGWVDGMLRSQGNMLYIGPQLAQCEFPGLLRTRLNRVRELAVSDRDAATMFRLNAETWRSHSYVEERGGSAAMAGMLAALEAAAAREDDDSHIVWGLRQIAWQRI